MARKRIGTRLRNIAEAALQDVEDRIVLETRDIIGKSTAAEVEDIFQTLGGRVKRQRTTAQGVLGMMAAEPEMAMEGAMDITDRQLALAGHGVQTYAEDHDTLVTNTQVARGTWVQLNLAKHQALLVQRVRVTLPDHATGTMALGLRWGRPASAIGTGAPGHVSPGVQFDFPEASLGLDSGSSAHQVHALSNLSFEWRSTYEVLTREVDLKPNFILIRSYCVVVGGGGGIGMAPHINLFGKIVSLNFGNILNVRS